MAHRHGEKDSLEFPEPLLAKRKTAIIDTIKYTHVFLTFTFQNVCFEDLYARLKPCLITFIAVNSEAL